MIERAAFTEKMISSFVRHYDISRADDEESEVGRPAPKDFAARCDLHMSESKYVLLEKNVIWKADSHEYCYIFSTEYFTKECCREYIDYVVRDGMSRIHPDKNHKCSVLTMIVTAGKADKEAEKELKHSRFHKSFRLSFHGWVDLRTALLVTERESICTNFGGHDQEIFLRKLLAAEKQKAPS